MIGGSYDRAEIESVAGTVRFEAALSSRAALSIETVSAPVELLLPATVSAEFPVSSFSGRITNELGPAAEKPSKWTPQTELGFTTGSGGARITHRDALGRDRASASGRSQRSQGNGRRQMKRATILAVFAVAAAPVLAGAAQEEFRWTGKVAAGQAIEIKGVNGGITATGSAGGDVEVTAIKKGRKSDPTEVKVEVVEHAGGVTICAVYPSAGAPNECAPGKGGRMQVRDNDVNVEFRVTGAGGRALRGPHRERRHRGERAQGGRRGRDRQRRRRAGLDRHGSRRRP